MLHFPLEMINPLYIKVYKYCFSISVIHNTSIKRFITIFYDEKNIP